MLTSAQKQRVALMVAALALFFFFLWGRLFWVQILKPDHWLSLAKKQHIQVLELEPSRGKILDRNLKPLAVSIQLSSVFADPRHVDDVEAAVAQLAALLELEPEFLRKRLGNKERGFAWIKRKISNELAAQIRALRIPGIHLMKEPQRVYPHGYLASHILGFAGIDAQGLEGVERQYDAFLQGEPGWRWLSRDARRRAMTTWDAPFVQPKDGLDVVLTIDTTIQFIAEQALDAAFTKYNAIGASIVVMDPYTREILALANRPNFDPNHYGKSPVANWRNRAVTDLFEPGSTFKVVTAALALGSGAVTPETIIDCEMGEYKVAGRILHDHKPHGELNFREVMAVSSNIGMAKIAMDMDHELIYNGIRQFGFGEKTGIELPGEQIGTVKHPRRWSKPTITVIPMGHEITVTALQMAQAIAVVANGGWLMQPRIIKEVRDAQGQVVDQMEPEPARRIITTEVANTLKSIMAQVVEEGTGRRAALKHVRVAGKTGTAQKIDPETRAYSHSKFVASFVGFAPVENPRLVIVVMVDEPRPQYYGGTVAGPVFRQVAGQTLSYLKQKEKNILNERSIEWPQQFNS